MPVLSQGSAYPEYATDQVAISFGASHSSDVADAVSSATTIDNNAWDKAVRTAIANVERVEALNSESTQRGNSWALPVEPGHHGRVPVWSGRAQWQRQVRALLNSDPGAELCKSNSVSTEATFAVAVVHAGLAESRTGRGVTAARATIAQRAGVSESVVKRARRVLTALGVAAELVRGRYLTTLEAMAAEAHHGRRQIRAASVWALSSPVDAVRAVAAPIGRTATRKITRAARRTAAYRARIAARIVDPQQPGRGPLSPSGGFSLESSSSKYSPRRARARAGMTRKERRDNPRPIHLQRAAGQLLAHAPALNRAGHVGVVCDVLERSGVDTTRWSGRDISLELTEDTQNRGWVWPSRIRHPAAFLQYRLVGIDWTKPTPAERRAVDDRRRVTAQTTLRAELLRRNERARCVCGVFHPYSERASCWASQA
jgi:hypothetical protein